MRKANKSAWMDHLAITLGLRGALVRCVLLALILAQSQALAKPRIVALPFRSVNGLILVEAKVNGNPVNLVMDTGANHTIIDTRSSGLAPMPGFEAISKGAGISGNSVRTRVNLELGKQTWISQPVSVMKLEDLAQSLGMPFDGLLGQDILRQFRSIRIDFKAHVVELQQ